MLSICFSYAFYTLFVRFLYAFASICFSIPKLKLKWAKKQNVPSSTPPATYTNLRLSRCAAGKKLENLLCSKKLTYRLDQICYHSESQAVTFPHNWSNLWNILSFLLEFLGNYLITAIIKAFLWYVNIWNDRELKKKQDY